MEQKCEMVEKKILCMANEAQQLLGILAALAELVGVGPDQKIEVETIKAAEQAVPVGKVMTLCIYCNSRCHEICAFGGDAYKSNCSAMAIANVT